MTLSQAVYPLYKDYKMFIEWIYSYSDKLLFPPIELYEENEDYQLDLVSKAYVFMKRLSTDYFTFLRMDASDRERIFRMEIDLIKQENTENKKLDTK